MATTHTNEDRLRAEAPTEAETVEEEVIDASLYPDRAHHDELGHTEEPEPDHRSREVPPSPREQPAAPIDIGQVDE